MNRAVAKRLDLISGSMLLLLAAFWGGSFFFAEIALRELPPLWITLFRVGLAAPIMVAVVLLSRNRFPRDVRVLFGFLVMGALNNAIPFSLLNWAQVSLEGGLTAILNGATAVFGVFVAAAFFRDEALSTGKILGAILGLAGVVVVLGPSALSGLDLRDLAQLAVLGAALAYSLASVWGRLRLSDQPPLVNAAGMLVASTLWMIPVALWVEGVPAMPVSGAVWLSLIGVAVLSTALAYILYFSILVRAGAANLMLVTLLVPPFAIGLGAVFLGEALPGEAYVGFAIIALGLLITDGRIFGRLRG